MITVALQNQPNTLALSLSLEPRIEQSTSLLSGIADKIVSAMRWIYGQAFSRFSSEKSVTVEIAPSQKIELIRQEYLVRSGSSLDKEINPTQVAALNVLEEKQASQAETEKKLSITEKKRLKAISKALREQSEVEGAAAEGTALSKAANVTGLHDNVVTAAPSQSFLKRILSVSDFAFRIHERVSRWSSIASLEEIVCFEDKITGGEEKRYLKIWEGGSKQGKFRIAEQQIRHNASMITRLFESQEFLRKYAVKSTKSANGEVTYFLKTKIMNESLDIDEKNWGVTALGLNKQNELYHFYCDSGDKILKTPQDLQLDKKLEFSANPVLIRSKNNTEFFEIPQKEADAPPIIMVAKKHPVTGITRLLIAPIS